MLYNEITVTVKVSADTPHRMKDKLQMLEKFSKLPVADQQRMTRIMENPKALKALQDHWPMLESMFK